jgi:hypothetical protein
MSVLKSKIFFIPIYAILFGLVLVSCKGESNNQKQSDEFAQEEDYYEFQGFNLKDYDLPIMIMLPDETANIGASTKPEIIHAEDDFKWEIILGSNFHLLIDDWGDYTDMVASRKNELKELGFYKIKYLVDEKDFIFYEQELKVDGSKKAPASVGVPHKSYHVYGQKIIDGVTYVFRSRDEGYEKVIIELMAKSIKSIKPMTK